MPAGEHGVEGRGEHGIGRGLRTKPFGVVAEVHPQVADMLAQARWGGR
jgi:hypothetical protein